MKTFKQCDDFSGLFGMTVERQESLSDLIGNIWLDLASDIIRHKDRMIMRNWSTTIVQCLAYAGNEDEQFFIFFMCGRNQQIVDEYLRNEGAVNIIE